MFDFGEGQRIAAAWYGLPPVVWGWIVAALAILGGGLAAVLPWPAWLAPRPEPSDEPDVATVRRWTWLVVAAALVLHAPGFLGSFNIFDDQRQISADTFITSPSSSDVWTAAFGNYRGTNQELMYLSFQANWAVAEGAYPAWYGVHWLLLIPLLWLVARLATWLSGSRSAGPAAAALFATTPLVSELMCWISVRSHLFGLVFTLASAAAWVAYREGAGPRRWGWLVASALLFAGSQLSKPIFLYLPVWLVLFDVFERRRDGGRMLLDKLPHALVAGLFLYKILALGAGTRLVKPTPLGGSYAYTLLQDLNLVLEYGRTLFVPSQTGILPAWNAALGWFSVEGTPMVLINGFAPLASAIVLASVAAVAALAWLRGGWRLPALWAVGSAVTLATVLNVPFRGTAAAFEYRYTLSAQVLTAILLATAWVGLRRTAWAARRPWGPALVAVAVLAWRAGVTLENTAAWRTSEALWVRNAELYPDTYFSNYYAGKALNRAKRHHEAYGHFQTALKYHNGDDMLYKRLGDCEYDLRRFPDAREHWAAYFLRNPSKVSEGYRRRFAEVGLDLELERQRRQGRWAPATVREGDPGE